MIACNGARHFVGRRLLMLGTICKNYRKKIKKKLSDVAYDTGYSIANISKFENDKNYNYLILLWYVENGLDLLEMWR